MKMEKKIIAICMCALAIGLATALPLTHFTPRIVAAQTDDYWFNIKIDRANFSANISDNCYTSTFGLGIEPLLNFDAFNRQSGARIEYFELVFYTDNQQLARIPYYIGGNSSYVENPETFITLSRENWFNSDFRLSDGLGYFYNPPFVFNNVDSNGIPAHIGGTSSVLFGSGYINEKYSAIVAELENAQTIYLDIVRVGYTTFDGNDTVIASTNNPLVVQHIELTKNGDEFTFGYTEQIDITTSTKP
jgi:hypothetical protein